MKNKVTVNGVELTRAQVEQAMKELNTPEQQPLNLRKMEFISPSAYGWASTIPSGKRAGSKIAFIEPLAGQDNALYVPACFKVELGVAYGNCTKIVFTEVP